MGGSGDCKNSGSVDPRIRTSLDRWFPISVVSCIGGSVKIARLVKL